MIARQEREKAPKDNLIGLKDKSNQCKQDRSGSIYELARHPVGSELRGSPRPHYRHSSGRKVPMTGKNNIE